MCYLWGMSASRTIFLAIMVSALARPLAAQTLNDHEDLSNQIITGAWADPKKCNFSNAKPVAFENAATGSSVTTGSCISITAYWNGRAIYASEADAKSPKASITPELAGRRIGIYADERTLHFAPRHPKAYMVVGVYDSCATEWSGAMMVLGYCHFSEGAFLKVSLTRRVSKPDVR